jgi:hypothetical protein
LVEVGIFVADWEKLYYSEKEEKEEKRDELAENV